MMMPNMYGQPAMMNMAGVIPGNTQQPIANFGYGNNNVGFRDTYENMNNF